MDPCIEIIRKEEIEDILIIKINGYIDEPNANEIWENVFNCCVEMNRNILLDLSNISFFSSGGASSGGLLKLRFLLGDNDKNLILVGLSKKIEDELISAGFSLMFGFSSSINSAIIKAKDTDFISSQKEVFIARKQRREKEIAQIQIGRVFRF